MVVATQDLFKQKLAEGFEGEERTLHLMRRKGYIVAPLSKIEDFKDRGPVLYLPDGGLLTVPDLLCIHLQGKEGIAGLPSKFWLECKKKNAVSWYRINQAWQSGIDRKYWAKYLEVEKLTEMPVFISHLVFPTSQDAMNAQRVPMNKRPAPTGLYIHPATLPLAYDPNTYSRMVYWKIDDMKKVSDFRKDKAA